MDLLPIDLSLPPHINLTPRPKIPFSIYFKLATGSKQKQAQFHPYDRLSTELQLKILESCDAPTTFRLMQTSSGIRKAAMKLFWSHEDPWYCITGHTVTFLEKRTPPMSYFGKHVEQVELVFGSGLATYDFFLEDLFKAQPSIAEQIERYRIAFQRVFPSAKRIVFNPKNTRRNESSENLTVLARAFTPHYTVFISLTNISYGIRNYPPYPKDLYRLGRDSQWILAQKAWTRHSVLPPEEDKITGITGMVGTFLGAHCNSQDIYRERTAIQYLRHELYEKYHFAGPEQIPFICPRNSCGMESKIVAEWRDHTSRYTTHDGRIAIGTGKLLGYTSRLPAEIEDALFAKELEINKSIMHGDHLMTLLEESWGSEGSEQRRLYEKQFLAQLKDDPACKSQDDPQGSWFFTALQGHWDQYRDDFY